MSARQFALSVALVKPSQPTAETGFPLLSTVEVVKQTPLLVPVVASHARRAVLLAHAASARRAAGGHAAGARRTAGGHAAGARRTSHAHAGHAAVPVVPATPPVPVVPATPPVPVVPATPPVPVVPPVPPIVWQVELQVVPFGGLQVSPASMMPLPQTAPPLSHLMFSVAVVEQAIGVWLSVTVRVNVCTPEAVQVYDEPEEPGVVKFAAGAQA